MRGDGPHAGEVARDQQGEVDRALGRSADGEVAVEGGATRGAARVVSVAEIREALEEARRAGRGIVVLEVRRPGEGAVRACVPQMLWAALCDALYPDTLEEEHAASQMDDG